MQSVGEFFIGKIVFCSIIALELSVALIQEAQEAHQQSMEVVAALSTQATGPCPMCAGVNRLQPRDRYRRDNGFRMLVDYFNHLLHHQAEFTPTEIREASNLACQMFEDQGPIFANEVRRVPKGAMEPYFKGKL